MVTETCETCGCLTVVEPDGRRCDPSIRDRGTLAAIGKRGSIASNGVPHSPGNRLTHRCYAIRENLLSVS